MPLTVSWVASVGLISLWGSTATANPDRNTHTQRQENARAHLPPEIQLPAPPLADLPSESSLPRDAPWPSLPGEDQLPPLPADEQEISPGVRVQQNEPPPPPVWLRLAVPGHTSPVRALALTQDLQRLWSAGEDKEAHVWLSRADRPQWTHERVVRWDVTRSATGGRIYALAATARSMALAGSRAYGNRGDILLLDPVSGGRQATLSDPDRGHSATIVSLTFSRNGQRLASGDVDGRVVVWTRNPNTGRWAPRVIPNHDLRQAPPNSHSFFPLAWRDDDHLLVPQLVALSDNQGLIWNVEQITLPAESTSRSSEDTTFQRQVLPGAADERAHWGQVTALAVADQGRHVFSADARGRVFTWDMATEQLHREQKSRVITSLAAAPDGGRLLVGMDQQGASPGAAEVWEMSAVGDSKVLHRLPTAAPVVACAVAPSGGRCAVADERTVYIGRIDFDPATNKSPGWTPHAAPLNSDVRVAFQRTPLDQPSPYVIGVRLADRLVAFDPQKLQLVDQPTQAKEQWTAASDNQGGWDVTRQPDEHGQYWLIHQGRRAARLPWSGLPNRPRAWCWIPDSEGQAWAVAVNHRSDGVIQVLRLADTGVAPLIRRLAGHQSAVGSLSVSPDRRYLVSAGKDSLIGVWPIEDLSRVNQATHRWGSRFEIRDQELFALDVQPAGPAFHRGVRTGDQLIRLTWFDEASGSLQSVESPEQMLAVLRRDDELMPAFYFLRQQMPLEPFHMYPAWDALAWLFVSAQREWAFWTPRGYYDASFNGHKLFGWQVNRNRQESPDFYLANQFRERLERPALMSRLLAEGSLDAAWKATAAEASRTPPADVASLVVNQPEIEMLEPREGQPAQGQSIRVRVVIRTRGGQRLTTPKAFANGVLAGQPRLVQQRSLPPGGAFRQEHEYVWEAGLPNDSQVMLQVVAATDSEAAVLTQRTLQRPQLSPRRKPRIVLVSAGVNRYRDASIPALDFAAVNADAFGRVMRKGAQTLYQTQEVLLQNDDVTRPMWRVLTQQLVEDLHQDVTPDDLLVFFLSGHGVRDVMTDRYYYVGANAQYADIVAGRYQDCFSFSDFTLFADLPCRKLVILDTCYSGAIQSLQQRNLKAALRALQDDLVLTLTASEGHEQAFEERDSGLGRFTRRLLLGLRGQGDANQDGVVSLHEAAGYVAATVPLDNRAGPPQHPTFGPLELLDLVDIPLTQVED